MVDRTQFPQFMRRKQACEYLFDIWGIELAPSTLAKRCTQGRGPITHHAGRVALHSPEDLDAFARAHIRKAGRTALGQHALHPAALAETRPAA
jgi:hypothetical protein